MILKSQTRIRIASSNITNYKSLFIQQEIASHHMMELVVDIKNLEPISKKLTFDSKKYLGEKISLNINSLKQGDYQESFTFNGIITQVTTQNASHHQNQGFVIFTAKSHTILMDDEPNFTSYSELSLIELINRVYTPYEDKIPEFDINPISKTFIPYSVQNSESAFSYIRRMASQYGEWFYYDGSKLIFGKPDNKTINLTRGSDLLSVNISLQPISNNNKYFSDTYTSDTILDSKTIASKEIGSGANGHTGFTNKVSSDIFNIENSQWLNIDPTYKVQESLEKRVLKQKTANEINQVKVTGTSINSQIKLGGIIIIEDKKYRVTKINHHVENDDFYQNNFEAISAEFDAYPYTNINAYPISQSQVAIVYDNIDPEGLGRIKAQFSWQKGLKHNEIDLSTPWIRIATPHAGSDKGMQFIPEINEEVLIGFIGANAERPYVIGSLYNGGAKADSWRSSNNDIKAIRTRSGHTIQFDDKNGSESIIITDKSNNVILIDTANSSIKISAPENIDIEAKNITISASEELRLNAQNKIENIHEDSIINIGKNKKESIKEEHELNSKNSIENVLEDKKISAGGDLKHIAKNTLIHSKDGDMLIYSKKKLTIQSDKEVDITE